MTISNFDHVKVLGSRHCFNKIADAGLDGRACHLSLERMISYDFNGMSVKFGAGVTYSKLMQAVNDHGLAF